MCLLWLNFRWWPSCFGGFFKNLSHHIVTVGHNRENHNSSHGKTTSFFNSYIVGLSKLVRLADRRITSFVLNSYIDELSNYRIVELSNCRIFHAKFPVKSIANFTFAEWPIYIIKN